MNYRGRQVKLMWERDLALKKQAWLAKEQTYKQDIINLQNSTDAKIIEGLEQEIKEKDQSLVNLQTKQKNLEKTKEEREAELNHNLSLKESKITSLETNLLNLAKQKLTTKKEAQKLVSQIEQKWTQKQTDWEQQNQRQQEYFAQTLAQTKQEHQQEIKFLKQQHSFDKKQAIEQTQRQGEQKLLEAKEGLEGQISSLELKLEVNHREIDEKQTKIRELQEWSTGQHNRILELEQIQTANNRTIDQLRNYRPKFREYFLKSFNFLETKINEFANWLNEDPNRKAGLSEWDKVFESTTTTWLKEAKTKAEEKHADMREILNQEIIVAESIIPYELKERREEYLKVLGKWAVEVAKIFTAEEWAEREREQEDGVTND